MVVVRGIGQGQGMGALRRDSYVMEVDRERNCYACDVKIIDGGLHLYLFSLFHFIFLCLLFSIFYF